MHLQGGTYNVQFFSYREFEKNFVNKFQVKLYNTIKNTICTFNILKSINNFNTNSKCEKWSVVNKSLKSDASLK